MKTMKFYHGTSIKIGQEVPLILLPPSKTNNLRETFRKKLLNAVFITTSFSSARRYAYKSIQINENSIPLVLLVNPDLQSLVQNNPIACPTEYICDFAYVIETITLPIMKPIKNELNLKK